MAMKWERCCDFCTYLKFTMWKFPLFPGRTWKKPGTCGRNPQVALWLSLRLPWWFSGKESICQCSRHRVYSWIRKIPWRRKWQPTPVFWPGKSFAHRTVAGYSLWGHKRVRHNSASKWPLPQKVHFSHGGRKIISRCKSDSYSSWAISALQR